MKYFYSGANIKKGSRGDDVSSWQKFLKEKGYYNGAIDGDFGGLTDAATRAYQTDHNLTIDGLVGSQTWGNAGFVNYNDHGAAPDYETDYYMGNYLDTVEGKKKSDAVGSALENLDAYGPFDFKYDVNEDALYQQAVERYQQMGKLAMEDTMGQASALTGGYGNSYAATVGNQAYQSYMQEASDALPEYYQRALNEYTNKYSTEYDRLKGIYDRAVSDLDTGEQMHRYAQADKNTAYANAVDEYNADKTEKTNAKKAAEAITDDEVSEMLKAIGLDPNGEWDASAERASGDLSKEEAYEAWENGKLKAVTDADRVGQFSEETYKENIAREGVDSFFDETDAKVQEMLLAGADMNSIVDMLIELVQDSYLNPKTNEVEGILTWNPDGQVPEAKYDQLRKMYYYRINQ